MKVYKHIAVLACLFTLFPSLFAQKQTVTVQVKNEVNVNTKELEFSPTFYEDGIIFISTNNAGIEKEKDDSLNMLAMSILHARRNQEGELMTPEIFSKEITSKNHEGPVCLSPTGDMIYFSRNAVIDGIDKVSSDGIQKMRIYSSAKQDNIWSTPIDLGLSNSEFNDCHPALNIDGDKLYFASDRPGGFGKMDLYVSFKTGDTWGTPINLGPSINTAGNEVFPFIHADNTLYFASTGRGGKGGLDIFQTTVGKNGEWSKPIILPEPFNTAGDDFGLIVDLNKINGYFSSNGTPGQGQDDILSFNVLNGNLDDLMNIDQNEDNSPMDLLVTITDAVSGKALAGADVRLLDLGMGDVIGRDESGNLITVVKVDGQDVLKAVPAHAGLAGISDKKGRYGTTLTPGTYSVTVSLDGYQTKQISLTVAEGPNKVTIPLSKVMDKVLWNASVFNYLTNAPLSGATAVVIDLGNGKKDTIMTDENGKIQYYLNPNTKYKVDLYQGGRKIGSTEVESGAAGSELAAHNISVAPLLPGTVMELPNIYYNYNDASLRPDARKDLDIVVALMKQHTGISVELSSHTDSRGTANYNQQLSQKRANGVVEYLVTKGISRNRLLPIGNGESKPRNNCVDGIKCSETDYARNRRTEVKMITGVNGSSMVYVDGELAPSTTGASGDPQPFSDGGNKNEPEPIKHDGGLKVSTGQAQFYVVAGSFLAENRAQNQLQTLITAGYNEAKIIRFEGSNFYSICVQQFDTRSAAEAMERTLETKNKIDAFVRASVK